MLHEYIEDKTTTHEFADLDTCLGSDESKWSFKFDGAATNQVTLSNDTAVANLKTPLKVTHAADCSSVPPTLTVQMDTVHDGRSRSEAIRFILRRNGSSATTFPQPRPRALHTSPPARGAIFPI